MLEIQALGIQPGGRNYPSTAENAPNYFPTGYTVTPIILRGGGVQGKFYWRIRFEVWAPQVPLIIRETIGEVLGPRRPTVSELRPARKLGVK